MLTQLWVLCHRQQQRQRPLEAFFGTEENFNHIARITSVLTEEAAHKERSSTAFHHLKTASEGFPPDLLHDLFEGVVPVEIAHCLKVSD
ncbi:uncharacterized protein [Nothobranchius furzeri]|uniref:uncharacterized protein isoform X2 n=1 Tax=Nothobranchius furzeri TaxID=105023 RepID=UPI002403E4A5|nr:uncharacterized protein LOC129165307 isoform X4 [Nothobranchius furzeri]XP_054604184.1 uncharacterized protein LOC129165312 isoform X5 [Nothobranchius furzeri]XP_054604189.1 uncharacterized protein LOC129165313 isoform X5 [Nothobranchius furzeri]